MTILTFRCVFLPNRYLARMDTFSAEFKSWMDSRNFTADTLAPLISKEPGTIKQWRSRGVPERESVRRFLTEFMATYQPPVAAPETPDFTVRIDFTDEEMAEIAKAAEIVGTGARDFIRRASVHQARVRIKEHHQSSGIISMTQPQAPRPQILAAAGSPIGAEVMDWHGAGDTVAVKISGLSMEPLLHDGDVISMKHKRISRSPFMKKGLIYLVEYDGGFTVKRYNTRPPTPEERDCEWVENGKVRILESLNPDYPEIIIKAPLDWIAWLPK